MQLDGPPLHGTAGSQPLLSAPSRGQGLWAGGANAPAGSVTPALLPAAAVSGLGLVFPLTRPVSLAPETAGHHGHSASTALERSDAFATPAAARSVATSSWSVPPSSTALPPRTKIICTIGPSSQSTDRLRAMLQAGMNVARCNFSHGDHEYHRTTIANLRDVTTDTRRICAILLDTKGPEIRTGKLAPGCEQGVTLAKGAEILLSTDENVLCDSTRVSVGYSALPKLLRSGHHVLIDDGLLSLLVLDPSPGQSPAEVRCRVLNAGVLGGSKSVNLPGVSLDLPAVTQKDVSDLRFGVEQGVDFIAASFVRRASDVHTIRKILGARGAAIKVISKIENQEGLDNFEGILEASDGIMVARGDLGVEIPLEQVALAQKRIIRACNAAGKFVITATQMLESMCANPSPTRAEASDVANAVLDGTDCVMLSAETAAGKYPVETVQMMADICREAEAAPVAPDAQGQNGGPGAAGFQQSFANVNATGAAQSSSVAPSRSSSSSGGLGVSVTEAIARSSVRATFDLRAAVILVLTETGSTARLVSKYRPRCPIITVTSSEQTARQSLVSRGLFPLLVGSMLGSESLIPRVLLAAQRLGMCKQGDLAVVTSGSREATAGATNDMKVVCVAT